MKHIASEIGEVRQRPALEISEIRTGILHLPQHEHAVAFNAQIHALQALGEVAGEQGVTVKVQNLSGPDRLDRNSFNEIVPPAGERQQEHGQDKQESGHIDDHQL